MRKIGLRGRLLLLPHVFHSQVEQVGVVGTATRWLTTLHTIRRSVLPTAMGRIPPSGFRKAVREAPKNISRTDSGIAVRRTKPANLAKVKHNLLAASAPAGLMRSFKCCGFNPSKPQAEPLGNDMILVQISPSLTLGNLERLGIFLGKMHLRWLVDVLCAELATFRPSLARWGHLRVECAQLRRCCRPEFCF